MATCKVCIGNDYCFVKPLHPRMMEKSCKQFKNKADFVEVVRCKDCMKGFTKFIKNEKYIECQLYHHEDKRQYKDEMDFCSHGVRKDDV